MRPGRPGSGWVGRCGGGGSSVRWPHRRGCCARRGIGSRPTRGTRCTWPGCWPLVRSPKWRCPVRRPRPRVIWCAGRDDARAGLVSAPLRVAHLLLRQGVVYSGGTPWTREHENWLRTHRFGRPALQAAYDAALEALAATEGRRDRLDEAITGMAAVSRFTPVIDRLACLRGISTLTGFGLAVEIGDWHRLSPITIGAYLGLVPGEHSTGESRSLHGVTKTGNSHVRRLLVEAAWHHRPPYRPSTKLQRRWQRAPGPVVAHAAKGNRRLHARWQSFDARRKRPVVANAAIARELAGWCQAL